MFKMEIRTDGEAFRDAFTGEPDKVSEAMEIRRILNRVIENWNLVILMGRSWILMVTKWANGRWTERKIQKLVN